MISRDSSKYYTELSESVSRDTQKYQAPLLTYFISFLKKDFNAPLSFFISFNIVINSMLPIIVFYMCMRIGLSARESICVAIIFEVHPTLVRLSLQVQRENLYLLFILLFFLFSVAPTKKKMCNILSGLFAGLGTMTRIEAIELIPMYFLLSNYFCDTNNIKTRIKQISIAFFWFIIPFFLIIVFFVLYLNYSYDDFLFLIYNNIQRRIF